MEIIWLGGTVIALIVVWQIIKIIVGVTTSIDVSGRAYLRKALVERGLDPNSVPGGCIDDFVAFAKRVAVFKHGQTGGVAFRSEVVESLNTFADLFICWRENPGDPMFTDDDVYREIFERHGFR